MPREPGWLWKRGPFDTPCGLAIQRLFGRFSWLPSRRRRCRRREPRRRWPTPSGMRGLVTFKDKALAPEGGATADGSPLSPSPGELRAQRLASKLRRAADAATRTPNRPFACWAKEAREPVEARVRDSPGFSGPGPAPPHHATAGCGESGLCILGCGFSELRSGGGGPPEAESCGGCSAS